MADPKPKKPAVVDTTKWFYFTMLFLVVDYARPQDLIPGLGAIRPGLLVMLVLIFYLIKHRKLIPKGIRQIRMIWYFIGLLALFVPFAVNGFYAYTTFEGMLNYMPFVLSVLVCVNSIERIRTFMKVYVGIMIYVAI